MIWLAVTRTTPRSRSPSAAAERASAAAAAAIASPWGASALAAGVGTRPRGDRVKSVTPSAASSASIWRPTVGCVSFSRRAAPESVPSPMTAKNVRSASHEGS